jgi:predicted ATP-grasp superfamily ATP-dependent carboligase
MPTTLHTADAENLANSSDWLIKQRASGGGINVEQLDRRRPIPKGAYLQEFVEGEVWGVSYLAADGKCRLLGVCAHADNVKRGKFPFVYQGSIGPLPTTPTTTASLIRLGEALAAEFAIVGLFGVDLIAQSDGSLRPLEINPRYTASMELFERAGCESLIDCHVHTCRANVIRQPTINPTPAKPLHGKRIVYHEGSEDLTISAAVAEQWISRAKEKDWPDIADIPQPGTHVRSGDPIATVFAAAGDRQSLTDRLAVQAERLLDDIRRRN